jgi:hypothetical protein
VKVVLSIIQGLNDENMKRPTNLGKIIVRFITCPEAGILKTKMGKVAT